MFELLQELGKGGFATTYRARVLDADLREEFGTDIVAVKIPLNKQKERVLRRELELNAGIHMRLRGLASPHIVRYLGFVSFRDQITMVMEYVEQGSLRRLLGRVDATTPLPVAQAVEIAAGMLEGLSVIHDEGILHRDIKPENVLMKGAIPKIADLGISRMLDEDELAMSVAGTSPYIAPEILTSNGATFSADLWSVTVTLYEMLTGRLPFGDVHTPLRTMIENICEVDPDPPSRVLSRVPAELDAIIAKGFQKRPEDRYLSAHEMRLALHAWQRSISNADVSIAPDAQTTFDGGSPDRDVTAPSGVGRTVQVRRDRSTPRVRSARPTPPSPPPAVSASDDTIAAQTTSAPASRRRRASAWSAAALLVAVAWGASYFARGMFVAPPAGGDAKEPVAAVASKAPSPVSTPPQATQPASTSVVSSAPPDAHAVRKSSTTTTSSSVSKPVAPVSRAASDTPPPPSTLAMLGAALKSPTERPTSSSSIPRDAADGGRGATTTWLSAAEYQDLWRTETANGFHPVNVEGRLSDGRDEFRAAWERTVPPCQFLSHHGLMKDTFDKYNAQYSAQGFIIKSSTQFVGRLGITRYQAVWVKGCHP
jgi:serine/threonine-protein kinase